MEKAFLTRIDKNDMEISMPNLLATKQKEGEPIWDFIKRFPNFSLYVIMACLERP